MKGIIKMKVKLLGIMRQEYDLTREGGPKFAGNVLQCATVGEEKDGLVGELVKTIKIADSDKLAKIPLELGKTYTVYFDDKKKIDYLQEVVK